MLERGGEGERGRPGTRTMGKGRADGGGEIKGGGGGLREKEKKGKEEESGEEMAEDLRVSNSGGTIDPRIHRWVRRRDAAGYLCGVGARDI